MNYADGDYGDELLAVERVRLLVHAGEVLQAPPAEALAQQASRLDQAARAANKSSGGEYRVKAATGLSRVPANGHICMLVQGNAMEVPAHQGTAAGLGELMLSTHAAQLQLAPSPD